METQALVFGFSLLPLFCTFDYDRRRGFVFLMGLTPQIPCCCVTAMPSFFFPPFIFKNLLPMNFSSEFQGRVGFFQAASALSYHS